MTGGYFRSVSEKLKIKVINFLTWKISSIRILQQNLYSSDYQLSIINKKVGDLKSIIDFCGWFLNKIMENYWSFQKKSWNRYETVNSANVIFIRVFNNKALIFKSIWLNRLSLTSSCSLRKGLLEKQPIEQMVTTKNNWSITFQRSMENSCFNRWLLLKRPVK